MTRETSPLPAPNDVAAWEKHCNERLERLQQEAQGDPLANPVRRFAYDLAGWRADEAITGAALREIAKNVSDAALVARGKRLATMAHPFKEGFEQFVDKVLAPLKGKSLADVRTALERTHAGVVFTAHPTFAMGREMRSALAAFSSSPTVENEGVFRRHIHGLDHAPDMEISLFDEHAEAVAALENAQATIRSLLEAIVKWCRREFPDDWRSIAPQPISLASWVGYDLDGRTDIHWAQTFRLRLEEKARQLTIYGERAAEISKNSAADLSGLEEKLRRAAAHAQAQADKFDGDLDDPNIVVAASNSLTANHPDKIIDIDDIQSILNKEIDRVDDEDTQGSLCVLRSEVAAYGFGVARIHLRVNAAQVRSALRTDLGLDPGREFQNRSALAVAAEKSSEVSAKKINFASVFLERMTARRQFMLCAQFAKHVDASTPIRFLIAECEAPATVMGAVYLARLYGVDHLVDISPLFETPEALERGGRFMERLLEEPEFVAYIRRRGRIAIQLGFSDSGRFMGQLAAEMAIERLHILLARELAAREIRDVEVVLFNTHGESMGRGGYPGSFKDRFDHLLTPWTRARYAHEHISVNAEASFQGGDGFLYFQTPELANSTVLNMCAWSFQADGHRPDDQFYADINYSWDIYRNIKAWQESLFDNEDYQLALSDFSRNMLYSTGSRKVRRQKGSGEHIGARSLRAIPHNAILQQLAAPANVCGGIGASIGTEVNRFLQLNEQSERLRSLVQLGLKARRLTSLSVLRGYASLYDPSFWSIRAAHDKDVEQARIFASIARRVKKLSLNNSLNRLANLISDDRRLFDQALAGSNDHQEDEDSAEDLRQLYILHSIRLTLIMDAFAMVASVPDFSQRHDVTRESLLDMALRLDFEGVADTVDMIFPVTISGSAELSAIEEPVDENPSDVQGYPEIKKNVSDPLRRIQTDIRNIGVGISHFYGAYG